MIDLNDLKNSLSELQDRLGYHFKNEQLLVRACIHSSFVNENRDQIEGHNERLEFLGDAVLGVIVSELLFHKFPQSSEGELSRIKAQLVEATSCVSYIHYLGLESFLVVGKGEAQNKGRGHHTILSDFFEALIAAIYLDGGFEVTKLYFTKTFSQPIEERMGDERENAKVKLQDRVQKEFKSPPEYRVLSEEGPHHERIFTVGVFVNGEEVGRGEGHSKKEAQSAAAKAALEGYEQS